MTFTVEERVAEFTRLYEARAYLVYNLALRITCERKGATAAAETAFLRQAEAGASEETLLPALVTAALGEAKRKPKPGGVGEVELALLQVAATMAPPERAALALAVMADLQSDDIAGLLQLGQQASAELLERATANFATGHGVEPGAVYDIYLEWGWAEPAAELWEAVYPRVRRALERPEVDTSGTIAAAEIGARPGRARRWRGRLIALATAGIAAAAVVAILAATPGSADPSGQPPAAAADTGQFDPGTVPSTPPTSIPDASQTGKETDPVAAMQAKRHKPLTPRELDQLRLKELAALRNYQKRETDKRLTKAQRNYAASKVSEFRELARQRAEVRRDAKALASREHALARARQRIEVQRQKEASKEAAANSQAEPKQTPQPKDPQPSKPQNGGSSQGKDEAPTQSEADQTCVQDQDTGAYICPEG